MPGRNAHTPTGDATWMRGFMRAGHTHQPPHVSVPRRERQCDCAHESVRTHDCPTAQILVRMLLLLLFVDMAGLAGNLCTLYFTRLAGYGATRHVPTMTITPVRGGCSRRLVAGNGPRRGGKRRGRDGRRNLDGSGALPGPACSAAALLAQVACTPSFDPLSLRIASIR